MEVAGVFEQLVLDGNWETTPAILLAVIYSASSIRSVFPTVHLTNSISLAGNVDKPMRWLR